MLKKKKKKKEKEKKEEKKEAFRWKDYYPRFTLTNFGLMIVKLQPCYETNENGLRYAVYARERACVCVYMCVPN